MISGCEAWGRVLWSLQRIRSWGRTACRRHACGAAGPAEFRRSRNVRPRITSVTQLAYRRVPYCVYCLPPLWVRLEQILKQQLFAEDFFVAGCMRSAVSGPACISIRNMLFPAAGTFAPLTYHSRIAIISVSVKIRLAGDASGSNFNDWRMIPWKELRPLLPVISVRAPRTVAAANARLPASPPARPAAALPTRSARTKISNVLKNISRLAGLAQRRPFFCASRRAL